MSLWRMTMSWILRRSICRPTLGSQIGDDASEGNAKICPSAWSKEGSGGGKMDPAALPLSGFLPFYILVRAFLISRTQLSQNLEQTKASGIERVGKSVTSVRSPWLLSTDGLLYRLQNDLKELHPEGFYGCEKVDCDSYLKESAFTTTVKRDAKF